MSQDYARLSLNKVQKGYCIEERELEMQRRDLRGKRWEVGLERWAAHEWMGERRNSKCGSIYIRCGLGTMKKFPGLEPTH